MVLNLSQLDLLTSSETFDVDSMVSFAPFTKRYRTQMFFFEKLDPGLCMVSSTG